MFELFKIPGLGAKKIRLLYETLGIETIGELEYACKENRLLELPGFGQKTQENILKGISLVRTASGRYLLHEAEDMALGVFNGLKECPEVNSLSIAGSLRRKKEIIKDIDILAASDQAERVMDCFVALPDVADIIGRGPTKASVRLQKGIAVDLRVVSPEQYPYALHHFTGSKEHNTKMRHTAKSLGLKMNEYGLFREADGSRIPCSNEEELFKALGMAYIPPELREDTGEIEAAMENRLPDLVERDDLKGIFHINTCYSDGINSIKELAEEARRPGYQYIGIADHSRSAYYAGGLSEDDVIRQHEEIDALNEQYEDFHIFKGIESDILPDGSLDYPDEFLRGFDYVIISVHSQFRMDRESMTRIILKAMDHPAETMLVHQAEGCSCPGIHMKRIWSRFWQKQRERNSSEINANPHRLDLDWRWIKRAKEIGVKLMINPDAHSIETILIRNTA